MVIKKALELLTNQYIKSFIRFENEYSSMSDYDEKVEKFQSQYHKLRDALLNYKVNEISETLFNSWIYAEATVDEQKKLISELIANVWAWCK